MGVGGTHHFASVVFLCRIKKCSLVLLVQALHTHWLPEAYEYLVVHTKCPAVNTTRATISASDFFVALFKVKS